MASTDLMTYLNYIAAWETESDTNIDSLITEHSLFLNLDNFNSDSSIDAEFSELTGIARKVRDLTIAADATQIAADAAAVASIWSFGLGMVAFAALEAAEVIERKEISSKSNELSKKLKTIDTDISARINVNVSNYIHTYKKNNNLIVSKAPKGLNPQSCRGDLLQFMAQVQRKTSLTAENFRKYAGSARLLFDSKEINKVYDALDELNLGNKADTDVKKFMNVLVGLDFPRTQLSLVHSACILIMGHKIKIANAVIKAEAEAAGIEIAEVETSVFEAMDAVGKFTAGIVIIMSVVDIFLNVYDISDVVKQCNKLCDELDGTIKTSYKEYFNGIKISAKKYRAAIAMPDPGPGLAVGATTHTAGGDIKQMQDQINQYGSITQFGVRVSLITGTADNISQTTGQAAKTDRGFGGRNGTWEVGNWGDTLRFT